MSAIRYHTTEADRRCKLCGDMMARGTWGIVLRNMHVSPKVVDLHFHEGCFMRSLEDAKTQYANDHAGHV